MSTYPLIEKLHLYDIFGYFLPGIAMVGLLWLPFGVVRGTWPSANWGSAVMTLAFTYILGLLLQGFATNAIPSSIARTTDGHYRYPSEVVIDPDHSALGRETQHQIAAVVKENFDLDIQPEKSGDLEIDLRRRAAFLYAHRLLTAQKASGSIDQFEGLYALMRGLVAALAVAFVYFGGWSAGVFRRNGSTTAAVIMVAAGMLIAVNAAAMLVRPTYSFDRRRIEKLCTGGLLLAFGGIGYAGQTHLN